MRICTSGLDVNSAVMRRRSCRAPHREWPLRLASAEELRDTTLQVVQGVAVLREDDQLPPSPIGLGEHLTFDYAAQLTPLHVLLESSYSAGNDGKSAQVGNLGFQLAAGPSRVAASTSSSSASSRSAAPSSSMSK